MTSRFAQAPLFLAIVALSAWLLGVGQHDKLGPMEPSVWEFVEQLPAGYWLAFALICAAIVLRLVAAADEDEDWLTTDLILMFVFCVILFATPVVLEGSPRFFDSYEHYAAAAKIDRDQDITFPSRDLYVGEVPGAFLLFTAIHQVSGISDLDLMLWYPVISRLLIALTLFALARTMGYRRGALAAPLVFLAGGWFEEMHLSPQSVGLLLYCCVLFCLARLWLLDGPVQAIRWRLLTIFFAGAAVFAHPGSPIFVGLTVAAVSAALLLSSRHSRLSLPFLRVTGLPTGHYMGLFLISTVGFLMFQMLFADDSFNAISRELGNALRRLADFQLPSFTKSTPLETDQISSDYATVNQLRQAGFLAFALLGLITALYVLRLRSDAERSRMVFLGAAIAGCSLFLIVPSLIGGSLLERAAMFDMLSLAVVLAWLFARQQPGILLLGLRAVSIAAIVATAALLPVTRSASDAFEWPSTAELDMIERGVLLSADGGPQLLRIANNYGQMRYFREASGAQRTNLEVTMRDLRQPGNAMIALTPTGHGFEAIQVGLGDEYEAYAADLAQRRSRIYDAGDGINLYFVR